MFRPPIYTYALAALLFGTIRCEAQIHYAPAPSAIVQLDKGVLQGTEPAPGVRAYLGIRYAKPPVGPLRWAPPEPLDPWSGMRSATAHGAPCPQQKFGWNDASADHGSEDCLFLNVWAPTKGKKLPVMVYIHGGSNVAGSASEELSNGFALVPRGIILVTLNYRLGIFGFFRSPLLDESSPHHASGDYGLLDQIAALQWVRENIARFGGDPEKVTVFGESAGAVDTGLLMASPLAHGLFARAIEESGQIVGLMPTATRQQSESAWAPVAKVLGPDLATMRSLPTAAVMKADLDAPKPPPENFWGERGASVDGWVLPALPATLFAEGKEAPVPLIIGSNVQEIVPHNQSADWTNHLIEYAVGSAKAVRLEAIYARPPKNALEGDAGARFQTDRDFRCAVLQEASLHSAHGFSTYVYQFDRSAGSDKAATHGSELGFVFGYFPSHKQSSADDEVAKTIQAYWTSFASTGVPVDRDSSAWPNFSRSKANYLEFTSTSSTPVQGVQLGDEPCTILTDGFLPGAR